MTQTSDSENFPFGGGNLLGMQGMPMNMKGMMLNLKMNKNARHGAMSLSQMQRATQMQQYSPMMYPSPYGMMMPGY